MRRWLLSLPFLALGHQAAAYCTGQDLLPTLTPAETAQIETALAATPYARGNHWIATRGTQVIHVIGTMHLDDPRWDPVVAQVLPIVSGSGRLLVEMTDEDQAEMQRALAAQPEKVFITHGPTLPELLSEEDWQRLSSVMAERGLPGFMSAKMQPWMQTLMLGMPACALQNPELAKNGLDLRLMRAAREAGVPVASLETFDELFALLAEGSTEDQLRILMASLPFAEGAEDQFATVSGLYFREDNAAAWEFARIMAYRGLDLPADEIEAMLEEFRVKLLDIRNRAWMYDILAAGEDRVVVAVGALHLMGETGVLRLLEEEGYSLSRAAFR